MFKFITILFLSLIIGLPAVAQEHKGCIGETPANFVDAYSYSNWFNDGGMKTGTHYFMMTMDNCGPCNVLKSRLKAQKMHGCIIYIHATKEPKVYNYFNEKFGHNGMVPFVFSLNIIKIDGDYEIAGSKRPNNQTNFQFLREGILKDK